MAAPSRLTRVRTRWLINILLLAVVAALAAYALYGPPTHDTAHEPIAQLAPSVVQRIAIEATGADAIELVREGDTWFVTRPVRARANVTQVERLLDLLAVRGRDRMPARDLENFDLDRPALRVQFDETVIAFGTVNPLTQDQYVSVGDAVYMIPGHHRSAVPDRVERVLTHALLRKDEKPVSFAFPGFSVERVDGRWIRRPEATGTPLSQDDFHRWVDEWRFASSLLTQRASGNANAESISIELEDGRTVRFGIVQKEPEFILRREDEQLTFYFPQDTRTRLLAGPAPLASAAAEDAPGAAPAADR